VLEGPDSLTSQFPTYRLSAYQTLVALVYFKNQWPMQTSNDTCQLSVLAKKQLDLEENIEQTA
jgi:hypothetical protein